MKQSRHVLPRPYHPRVPLTRGQMAVIRYVGGRWQVREGAESNTLKPDKRLRVLMAALRHVRKLNADPTLLKGSNDPDD